MSSRHCSTCKVPLLGHSRPWGKSCNMSTSTTSGAASCGRHHSKQWCQHYCDSISVPIRRGCASNGTPNCSARGRAGSTPESPTGKGAPRENSCPAGRKQRSPCQSCGHTNFCSCGYTFNISGACHPGSSTSQQHDSHRTNWAAILGQLRTDG